MGWGPDGGLRRLESGVLILDHGGDTIRSMRPDRRSVVLRRGAKDAIRGPAGRLWAASLSGRVEVFHEDLELVDSLQLELPGVAEWDREAHPGAWSAQVNDIRLAPDGTGVWVGRIRFTKGSG